MTAKRILVVEDEAIITADLRNKVERLGYVVCGTAFSGEDAIQKADDTEPDLVLMDVRLRGNMTGVEAASQIRKRRNVPVIYITAYVGFLPETDETRDTSLWLSKPFSSSELKKILESALKRVQS